MNTNHALWMACEASDPLNNLVDLLMGNVDLFALFPQIETATEQADGMEKETMDEALI